MYTPSVDVYVHDDNNLMKDSDCLRVGYLTFYRCLFVVKTPKQAPSYFFVQ